MTPPRGLLPTLQALELLLVSSTGAVLGRLLLVVVVSAVMKVDVETIRGRTIGLPAQDAAALAAHREARPGDGPARRAGATSARRFDGGGVERETRELEL